MILLEATAEVAGGNDYVGELFVLGGIVLTGILGLVTGAVVKKLRDPVRYETLWQRVDSLTKMVYGDEEKDEPGLVRRMEATERRDRAKGRVIRDLARQWRGEAPRLNPSDLDELDEDTLPNNHTWRMKP